MIHEIHIRGVRFNDRSPKFVIMPFRNIKSLVFLELIIFEGIHSILSLDQTIGLRL
jgi:hypothetical protein